jgi:transcription antitermination factor NusG
MTPPPLRWYAVRTKAKQELRAESNLKSWGIETLNPKLRDQQWRGPDRATVSRVSLLFPGYLFARFDAGLALAKVRLTRGIHSVVGFGEGATPIDEEIIAFIRSRVRDDGFLKADTPRPGDTVEILSGPLRSLRGVFEHERSGRDRVLILLSTLGGQTRVTLMPDMIRKIAS